ncbi:MAG: hypothetical protein ACQES9_05905 [Myxococcota bacterium]
MFNKKIFLLVFGLVLFQLNPARAQETQNNKKFGLGISGSYHYVPEFFLHIGLKGAHDVKAQQTGLRLLYRTTNVDVAVQFQYMQINAPDGNWLGMNHDWDQTEYVEFDNLAFAFVEVSATWNTPITDNLYFIYGAGIGGGLVLGDVYTTPAMGCTADNWRDTSQCYHIPGDDRQEKEDIPRGMGMLEAIVGLRYDIIENISLKVETGFFLPGFLKTTVSAEFYY